MTYELHGIKINCADGISQEEAAIYNYPLIFGSSASRKPSPNKLNASTVRKPRSTNGSG